MPLTLATDRLIVRPFRDDDLQPFIAYRSDPVIARYQSWDAPYSRARAVDFIEEMKRIEPGQPGQWYQLAIEVRATGQMIGDCGFVLLAEDGRQAEIGVTLARQHHGHGYATEALTRLLEHLFGELGSHRVRANCLADNTASARLLERLGMRREGHLVASASVESRWADEYWYAVPREEWLRRRR